MDKMNNIKTLIVVETCAEDEACLSRFLGSRPVGGGGLLLRGGAGVRD